MRLTAAQIEQIVEHALRDAPNECCGIVSVSAEGEATEVFEYENLAASPLRFEISGKALITLLNEIEDAGEELGAIYHSHTRSAPYPSQTDINFAANWPGVEWIIVGTAGEEPLTQSYLIEDGTVREVPVELAVG